MNNNTLNFLSRAAVGLVLVAMMPFTHAALVTIDDPGSDFTVTYDDENTGLFGRPFLSNNVVFFLPTEFEATSLNGQGQAITNSTIHMRLDVVSDNFTLDQFILQERGDYILNGAGAAVSVQGEIRLFDAANPFTDYIDHIDTGPLTQNDGENHDWVGNAAIDSTQGWTGAESVWITLENILIAETVNLNTLAFVEKKFEGVQILVNQQVPIPGALWLMLSGLVPLMLRRK